MRLADSEWPLAQKTVTQGKSYRVEYRVGAKDLIAKAAVVVYRKLSSLKEG